MISAISAFAQFNAILVLALLFIAWVIVPLWHRNQGLEFRHLLSAGRLVTYEGWRMLQRGQAGIMRRGLGFKLGNMHLFNDGSIWERYTIIEHIAPLDEA